MIVELCEELSVIVGTEQIETNLWQHLNGRASEM